MQYRQDFVTRVSIRRVELHLRSRVDASKNFVPKLTHQQAGICMTTGAVATPVEPLTTFSEASMSLQTLHDIRR